MTFTASNLRTASCPLSNIFYGKQTGCWVEKEKKRKKRERKIASSYFCPEFRNNKKFGQFSVRRSTGKDIFCNFSLSARQKLRHSRRLQRLYS